MAGRFPRPLDDRDANIGENIRVLRDLHSDRYCLPDDVIQARRYQELYMWHAQRSSAAGLQLPLDPSYVEPPKPVGPYAQALKKGL